MQTKTKKILAAIGMVAVVALLVGTAAGGRTPAPEVPASVASSGEVPGSEPEPASGQEASSAASAAGAASGTQPDELAPDEAPAETLPEEEADSAASEELLSGSTAASSAAHPAASSSAAASSHAASPAAKPSSGASSVTAQSGSEVDAWIDSYIRRIRALQRRSEKQLYQTASSAYSEYMSHPQKERNLGLKVSIVLSKTVELTNLQNECDKEFNAILKELRQYLKDNGRDQTIADEIEKEYKAEKDAMIKELTNLTYSQVTGKGEGGKWLAEHSDMAG